MRTDVIGRLGSPLHAVAVYHGLALERSELFLELAYAPVVPVAAFHQYLVLLSHLIDLLLKRLLAGVVRLEACQTCVQVFADAVVTLAELRLRALESLEALFKQFVPVSHVFHLAAHGPQLAFGLLKQRRARSAPCPHG